MYFGETNKYNKKTHTGFRLRAEIIAYLDYLVQRETIKLESNNMKANRTSVVECLIYDALNDEERRKARESIR